MVPTFTTDMANALRCNHDYMTTLHYPHSPTSTNPIVLPHLPALPNLPSYLSCPFYPRQTGHGLSSRRTCPVSRSMATTKPSGQSRLANYNDFLLSPSLSPGTGCCISYGAKGWNGHRAVDSLWSFPCGLFVHGSSPFRKTTSYRCRHPTGETIINDDNHNYKNNHNDELRISSSPILSQYPTPTLL